MAVSACLWLSRPQHVPTPPICTGDAIEITYSLSYGVMASAILPTRDYRGRRPARASPRRTDDGSAKLHYCRPARYRMITLVETRNYPEKHTSLGWTI